MTRTPGLTSRSRSLLRSLSVLLGVLTVLNAIVSPALGSSRRLLSDTRGSSSSVDQSGPSRSARIVYEVWLSDFADLYSSMEDGSDPQQLSQTVLASEMTPSWSPDGTQIAYVASNSRGIFVMNADGSNPRRFFNGPGYEWFPSWSPDGRRIAFASWDPDTGRSEIFTVGVRYRDLHRVTGGRSDFSPSWSPDGKWIAFVRWEAESEARHLYLVKPDGSRLIRRTHGSLEAFRPMWSPDSSRIAFQGWNRLDSLVRSDDIYIIDRDRGDPRRLTEGPDYDETPCWAPNGKEIVFSRSAAVADAWIPIVEVGRWVQSPGDLYGVTVDGGQTRQITSTPHVTEASCHWV